MNEIPSGKYCEMCPFDHVWDMRAPEAEDYVCTAFLKEPHRKEDYRNPSCLVAYPYGGMVAITSKEVPND